MTTLPHIYDVFWRLLGLISHSGLFMFRDRTEKTRERVAKSRERAEDEQRQSRERAEKQQRKNRERVEK